MLKNPKEMNMKEGKVQGIIENLSMEDTIPAATYDPSGRLLVKRILLKLVMTAVDM